jgi:hypothetical protein
MFYLWKRLKKIEIQINSVVLPLLVIEPGVNAVEITYANRCKNVLL